MPSPDPKADPKKLPNNTKYIFNVGMTPSGGPNATNSPYIPNDRAYVSSSPLFTPFHSNPPNPPHQDRWDMHIAPFRINFSDPTLLALDRLDELINQPHLDVVTTPDPEKKEEEWIWMVITAPDKIPQDGGRIFFPAAHPMHLHGHDFALLRQSSKNWYDDKAINHVGEGAWFTPDKLNCRNPRLKCDNPPRRDVVLLPATGYVIIAFKADNPGYVHSLSLFLWLINCLGYETDH
jgi:hypothetical protein